MVLPLKSWNGRSLVKTLLNVFSWLKILDSILEQQSEPTVTDAQQQELDRRLERYQQDPSSGSTWEAVKQRLGFSE
ncbi:addiction module protein [Phormidesmis sp. 146-12]